MAGVRRAIAAEAGLENVRTECLPAERWSTQAVAGPAGRHGGRRRQRRPCPGCSGCSYRHGARGSNAAGESADVVIIPNDLAKVAHAVRIGRRTVRVALESIWIGLALSVGLMAAAARSATFQHLLEPCPKRL